MKAEGLQIEIVLGDGSVRNVREELKIDLSQLSMELQEQPSWYAWYASLLAEATTQYERSKAEYDSLVAEVSSEIRAIGGATKSKVTEKQVALDTDMDSRVRGCRSRLIDQRKTIENLKVIVRAFEQRLDCLKQLGHLETRQQTVDPTFKIPEGFNRSSFGSASCDRNLDTARLSEKSEYMEELLQIKKAQAEGTSLPLVGKKIRR